MTLLELADWCAEGTHPDPKIDDAIARHLQTGRMVRREGEADYGVFGDMEWYVPAYTGSLGTACSLYLVKPERMPSNPRLATAEALKQRAAHLVAGDLL